MKPRTYITTSWDDGHPLDLHVAALLAKHGIAGTFYVPATTELGVMSAAQLRELTPDFEIGAHTLHHVDLTRVSDRTAWQEIADSTAWLMKIMRNEHVVDAARPLEHVVRDVNDIILRHLTTRIARRFGLKQNMP